MSLINTPYRFSIVRSARKPLSAKSEVSPLFLPLTRTTPKTNQQRLDDWKAKRRVAERDLRP